MSFSLKAVHAALVGGAFFALVASAQAEDKPRNSVEDQKNLISGLCTTQLDLGPVGCTCLADHALSELNEEQRAYLILSVVQPQAAEKMPIANSKDELAAIFNFLAAAHTTCAQPGAPAAPAPAGEQPTQQ